MIIGILGGKGSGKSTVADYLVDAYGATVYALADPLKETLRLELGLSPAQLNGTQEQKEAVDSRYGLSARQLMERQGDALRAVFGRSLLVEHCIAKVMLDRPTLAVVSDVRRLNEVETLSIAATTSALAACAPLVLWRLHYAPGLRRWEVTHESEAEWMLPRVDLDITPSQKGADTLRAAIDEACCMFRVCRKPASTLLWSPSKGR